MGEERFISVDEMQDKLEEYGHKAIWQSIEKIGKWQDRIMFRHLFFLAGGSLED